MATTEREELAVVSVLVETEGGDVALLDSNLIAREEAERLAGYWEACGHLVELQVLP